MKIASLLHNNQLKLDDRKMKLQRKEMAEAYKKSSSYVDSKKNPIIKAIEDLLQTKENLSDETLNTLNIVKSEIDEADSNVASTRDFNFDEFNFDDINNIENSNLEKLPFLNIDNEQFEPLSFNTETPLESTNRLLHDFRDSRLERDPFFSQELQKRTTLKKYQKAIATYSYQMNLVKNGYNVNQSMYSLTA